MLQLSTYKLHSLAVGDRFRFPAGRGLVYEVDAQDAYTCCAKPVNTTTRGRRQRYLFSGHSDVVIV